MMGSSSGQQAILQPSLEINSSSSIYKVDFPGVESLEAWHPEADLLLVDSFFRGQLAPAIAERCVYLKADEAAKSLDRMGELLLELKRRGINRSSTLLGLGGGVIQDITTFVASVYMRGVPWVYVPSTFLAMADSCLGGKSSINVGSAKNLIGTFHPPKKISLMAPLARSLPLTEIRGGLAEAAKICFCQSQESFEIYKGLAAPILAGKWSDQQLAVLLHHVLKVKQWFIETDEFDRTERRLLNYGHSWGHALESATHFGVPHGLGVAIGMLASHVYMNHPMGSKALMDHCLQLLDGVLQPAMLQGFDQTIFLDAFRSDKKHARNHYKLIVPPADGYEPPLGVIEIAIERTPSEEQAVLAAMLSCLEQLQR